MSYSQQMKDGSGSDSKVSFRERWKNQTDREEKPYASIWNNNYFIIQWALSVALLVLGLVTLTLGVVAVSLVDAGPTRFVFAGILGIIFVGSGIEFFRQAKDNIETFREKR